MGDQARRGGTRCQAFGSSDCSVATFRRASLVREKCSRENSALPRCVERLLALASERGEGDSYFIYFIHPLQCAASEFPSAVPFTAAAAGGSVGEACGCARYSAWPPCGSIDATDNNV